MEPEDACSATRGPAHRCSQHWIAPPAVLAVELTGFLRAEEDYGSQQESPQTAWTWRRPVQPQGDTGQNRGSFGELYCRQPLGGLLVFLLHLLGASFIFYSLVCVLVTVESTLQIGWCCRLASPTTCCASLHSSPKTDFYSS